MAAVLPPEPLKQSGALHLELQATHNLRLPEPLVVTRHLRSVFAPCNGLWRGRHELEGRAVMAPPILKGWSASMGCMVRDVGGGEPGVVDVSLELQQLTRGVCTQQSSIVHRRWAQHRHEVHSKSKAHHGRLPASRMMLRGSFGSAGGRVQVARGVVEGRTGLAPWAAVAAGISTPALPPNAPCSIAPARWDAAVWHASVEIRDAAWLPSPCRAMVQVDGNATGVRLVECSVRHHVPVFGKARMWLTWRGAGPSGGGLPETNGLERSLREVEPTKRGGSSVTLRWRVGKVPRLPVVEVLPAPMVELHVGVGVRTRALQSCGLQLCW